MNERNLSRLTFAGPPSMPEGLVGAESGKKARTWGSIGRP